MPLDTIQLGNLPVSRVILGGNPVYTAPADLDWAKTQRKAARVVRLGYYEDETFPVCDWHFPAAHYLESWGDARTHDGVTVPIQPMILPLFDGMNELTLLSRLLGDEVSDPYTLVYQTITKLMSGDPEKAFRQFLFEGRLGADLAGDENERRQYRH